MSWTTQTAVLEEIVLEWYNAMQYNTILTQCDNSVIVLSMSRAINECCLLPIPSRCDNSYIYWLIGCWISMKMLKYAL